MDSTGAVTWPTQTKKFLAKKFPVLIQKKTIFQTKQFFRPIGKN